MKMTAKFEAEGESFNACFEQLNSAFNAEFSASGGGQDGKDGATFTPSVSEDGVISWTNDRDLPNPDPINIKGENGVTPVKGIDYFTEEDVQEIAERAAEMVDVPEGGGGVTSWNDLTDKPDFAPIATSGSWNDLKDKPFSEGEAIEWKEVTGGSSSQTGSLTSFDVTPTSKFTLIPEKNYKIVVNAHMVGSRETIGIASKKINPDFSEGYAIGSVDDAVYLTARADRDGMISYFTITLAEPILSLMGVVINVYEETRAVKPLDEKFLPDSVVLEGELNTALSDAYNAVLGLGYQTEAQVTALINNALGVIENGTY